MEKCDVILVAAGKGDRFGGNLPKQFQPVLGRPLYLWSLEVFLNWPHLGFIVVVVPDDWVKPVQESLEVVNIHKKIQVVAGGSWRHESTYLGLSKLEGSFQSWVMIHDAARPMIDDALLNRVWDARSSGVGVIPGVSVPDTIKKVRASEFCPQPVVEKTVDRQDLVLVQTPQLFERDLLFKGYRVPHLTDSITDDAGLFEQLGYNVVVVDGSYDNLKVTFPEDLERVSRGLGSRHSPL